ncbi:hypothetical protein OJ253_746 [Cryptosporidium canis]|uniref:Sec1 family protein n=1 Tax=Cryptosporidium canis TaxID=195482 RepID=A0A9D5DI62_9CRYT|nr:hypothetical protein OJ253_746 [Cryptosporidium canis]
MASSDLREFAEKVRGESSEGVEFLFVTKAVEGCLISQEALSELLDFDIFCIDWQEFSESPKYTVENFGKVNSLNFVTQEPLIHVLGEILSALESAQNEGIELRSRIYLPYASEAHVEYAKNLGVLSEEISARGGKIQLRKFDFASILSEVNKVLGSLDISIETESWISVFFCNANLVCNSTWASVYATCNETRSSLSPIMEDEIEEIYSSVQSERKNQCLGKSLMPTLFSKENIKSDPGQLKLDNLPSSLRRSYSKHVLLLMSFVQQITGYSFLESESCVLNLLSMGPTSNIISKAMQESYSEMLRACPRARPAKAAGSKKDQVTLLIMDRTLDCVSPIYSPILNMNLPEDGDFPRLDDGILEFLDDFMLRNLRDSGLDCTEPSGKLGKESESQKEEAPCLNDRDPKESGSDLGNLEEGFIHEVTNPVYLSIMLDPEKLQKDLILSQRYPILSYRFISALEDLQGLVSSKERSFHAALKKDVAKRIDSIMDICPIYGHQSWMFLLLSLNQSQYTRRFWSDISEVLDCRPHQILGQKRTQVLSIVYKYLAIIHNDIISSSGNLSMKSPSTQTSSSSLSPMIHQSTNEEEEVVIGKMVSILLHIREMLLPDSVTTISKRLEDLSLNPLLCSSQDLKMELSSLLQILHYFLVPMFPLDMVSFNSIFVSKLRKRFTTCSFESMNAKDQGGLAPENPRQFIRRVISLAVSCSSYEGPDCKLSPFNLEQMIESIQPSGPPPGLGGLNQRLNSIRSARKQVKYKPFRNFQLYPFLPENTQLRQELQAYSLVAQVALYVLESLLSEERNAPNEWLKADLKMSTVASSSEESDLQILRNRLKETRKTLIINMIGSISMFEINEIERISKQFIEHVNIVVLTDHIGSATSITNSLITHRL